MNNELSTGDVARACGVSPDTIRYYERCGAFAGRRMANGYRRFPPETVQRVQIIPGRSPSDSRWRKSFAFFRSAALAGRHANRFAPRRRRSSPLGRQAGKDNRG